MNFLGYFMIWLAVTGKTNKPSIWKMCLYICIGVNSQTFTNTGALVPSIRNFPESRGSVLGLLKGLVGLSGAIITQLYHAFYGEDSKSLILLIAWCRGSESTIEFVCVMEPPAICLTCKTEKSDGEREPNEIRIFYNLLYISLSLAGFLMVVIIIQNKQRFMRIEFIGSITVVVLLLFLPLAIMIKEAFDLWNKNTNTNLESVEENHNSSNSFSVPECNKQETSCLSNVFSPPERGKDYTILQALFSVDMLILFVAMMCGVGGTLTAIENLGMIGHALGYPSEIVSGFASEIFLTKYKFPRPLMLTLILLVSCVGHVLISFVAPHSLYFWSVILGFCFGIFKLKYYANLHNLGGLASPIRCYILNVKVAGNLYDKEADANTYGEVSSNLNQLWRKEHTIELEKTQGLKRKDGEDLTCIGVHCYIMTFIIIIAAALFVGCFHYYKIIIKKQNKGVGHDFS
ncbi:hypothetical protein UlMin_005778 [Ulmus minor]